MINKKKFGFSLMELLLVMAIIAVILSIAFSVTKKGIENAYNRYFYTGYVGLYEALADVTIRGIDINDANFLNEVSSVLDGDLNIATITAPNGISYIFNQPMFNAPVNGDVANLVNFRTITMSVPSVNRAGIQPSARFVFSSNFQGGMLIPLAPANVAQMALQERPDLLPFYINTGIQGQVGVNNAGAGRIIADREILSYRDAHCRRYGTTTFGMNPAAITIVDCNGVAQANTVSTGFIQVANPDRVFNN